MPAAAVRGEEARQARLRLEASKAKPAKPTKAKPAKPTKAKPAKAPKAPKVPKPSKPAKKPVAAAPVYLPEVPPPPPPVHIRGERIKPGRPIVDKILVSSRHQTKASPDISGDILTNLLEAHARKGPFEPADVSLYSFGLKLVGHERLTESLKEQIRSSLPEGASFQYSDTRAGTEVYIRFDPEEPLVKSEASSILEAAGAALKSLFDDLSDYWGGMDWYLWFEVDESLYE